MRSSRKMYFIGYVINVKVIYVFLYLSIHYSTIQNICQTCYSIKVTFWQCYKARIALFWGWGLKNVTKCYKVPTKNRNKWDMLPLHCITKWGSGKNQCYKVLCKLHKTLVEELRD